MSLVNIAERYNEMSDELDNAIVANYHLEMELHDVNRDLADCQSSEVNEEDED